MITAIDYVCLETFQALTPAPDLIAISIGSPAQMPPPNLEKFPAFLRLEFLDCDESDVAKHGIPEEFLFNDEQLKLLLGHINKYHHAAERWRLVVHCQMGSSRSAAVALVAHHIAQCDFPRLPDAHYANTRVLDVASRELQMAIHRPVREMTPDEPHPYLPLALQI